MAQLAFEGHETRGREIIKVLEMLGGKERTPGMYNGDAEFSWYYIDEEGYIDFKKSILFVDDTVVFTLEEFLEKYPFKVGDFVHIPEYESEVRICKMRWSSLFNYVEYKVYRNEDPEWYTAEELLDYNDDFLVDKETNKAIFEGNAQCCNIMNDIIKDNIEEAEEGVYAYNEINCYHQDFGDKVRIRLGGDFEIKVEDKLIYIVRKKPQYPKTYEECCEVLGYEPNELNCYKGDVFESFGKLLICRDVYWEIAGKEMGLGKCWKPDWTDCKDKFCITIFKNKPTVDESQYISRFLAFPTEEMRHTFYENFKSLIEDCKELL